MHSCLTRMLFACATVLAVWGSGSAQELQDGVLPKSTSPVVPSAPGTPQRGAFELLTGERPIEAEPDEIETDRDSFTPATTIVGRRRLIVESGYSFLDNRGFKETHSVPELIFRYGLSDRIELRLGWNYEVGGAASEVSGSSALEEEAALNGSKLVKEYTLSYGAKFRVNDQYQWIPRSIVILQGLTPTGGASNQTQIVATYAAGWTLPNRWQFDSAIRYVTESEEGDHFNIWAPSAVLKVPLGEKWAAHAEYFGFITGGKELNTTKHYLSPGLHYLVTPDLEIGVRLGWGLNDQSARFFSNVGVGYRY